MRAEFDELKAALGGASAALRVPDWPQASVRSRSTICKNLFTFYSAPGCSTISEYPREKLPETIGHSTSREMIHG